MSIGFRAHYFGELAQLEANNFWFRGRNRLILWAIHKYSPNFKSFLEVGCGTGFVISAIAERFPYVKVSGSEYIEEGLVYARQRLPDASFTQMDARAIPWKSEFDAIGAFDVLEHIVEDETVLREMHKALNPGGAVLITVPQHRWLWSSVDEHACHVRRYGAKELESKMRLAGFEILRSTSFVSLLLPAMYLSRRMKHGGTDGKMDEVAELRIHPILNRVFEWFLKLDIALIRAGVSFPFGGSRMVVGQKALKS